MSQNEEETWAVLEPETIENVRAQRDAAVDIIRELGAELEFLRAAYRRVTGLEAPELADCRRGVKS